VAKRLDLKLLLAAWLHSLVEASPVQIYGQETRLLARLVRPWSQESFQRTGLPSVLTTLWETPWKHGLSGYNCAVRKLCLQFVIAAVQPEKSERNP
jgi:hypothetical protein